MRVGCRGSLYRFNPRSPRGGATRRAPGFESVLWFQSTLPTRGSDWRLFTSSFRISVFQSTLPTRGSDVAPYSWTPAMVVSIHAPHEGERPERPKCHGNTTGVSIHAPHEGERPAAAPISSTSTTFQSTLPTRGSDASLQSVRHSRRSFNPRSPRGGATTTRAASGTSARCFNPRSPRGGATIAADTYEIECVVSIHAPHEGERLGRGLPFDVGDDVSIHAPHEGERRCSRRSAPGSRLRFQSTLPTRGSDATASLISGASRFGFNPRSPRGGATAKTLDALITEVVSIHAPHEGERLALASTAVRRSRFQSTLPTRGSDDYLVGFGFGDAEFQSTLPTRGSDAAGASSTSSRPRFNPRSPRGGATAQLALAVLRRHVSIHAPHEGERHGVFVRSNKDVGVSIHAPHEGERQPMRPTRDLGNGFQSTLPTRGSDLMLVRIEVPVGTFQSTLPTRGSDLRACLDGGEALKVSIHAPHEGERPLRCGDACFTL